MTGENKILGVLAAMREEMASLIQSEVAKVNIKLETAVEPRLDALAEGHSAILE